MALRFVVDGAPFAWQRARMQRTGRRCRACGQPMGSVRGFLDEQTRSYEQLVAFVARAAMRKAGLATLDEPLCLRLTFTKAAPKRDAGKLWPMRRPDIDNLSKGVLDGLQKGGVYVDDARIIDFRAVKVYGPEPSTLVEIWRP